MTTKFLAIAALLFATLSVSAQTPTAPVAQPSVNVPLKVGGDVLPPKVIHSVTPKLQRSLFHAPKSNKVLVGLTVSPDGVPTDVHIVRSGGDKLDKAALDAVDQYRFQPSTLHGKPVAVVINVEFNFKIY